MSIYRKVRAVERIFDQLGKKIAGFQQESGLACLSGCGACCKKPDIEASVLEFLPLAYHLHQEGKSLEVWEKLKATEAPICFLFQPVVNSERGGFCGDYAHRGLVCRLFGFSAMRDKYGTPKLYTCKLIKESQQEAYDTVMQQLKTGMSVPIVSDYYRQLISLDAKLGNDFRPINKAIVAALEEVMHYYAYRPRRRPPKKAA